MLFLWCILNLRQSVVFVIRPCSLRSRNPLKDAQYSLFLVLTSLKVEEPMRKQADRFGVCRCTPAPLSKRSHCAAIGE